MPPQTGVGDEWIKGAHVDRTDPSRAPMIFQLLEQGHDMWFMYMRGKRYSRENVRVSPESAEYWDFSFEEVGTKDLVALTKLIYEKSGNQKVGMIGYSQGATNIFAGFAMKYEEFYKEHAFKVAQFCPCSVREVALDLDSMRDMDQAGVYVIGGPEETWEEQQELIKQAIADDWLAVLSNYTEYINMAEGIAKEDYEIDLDDEY